MKIIAAPLAALLGCAVLSRAEVPEPDNVVYGFITLGAVPVTSADTNVIVEARKSLTGPVVARYRMGDNPAYADAYSLEVPLEAFFPLIDPDASRVGALVYLSVRDPSGVRDTRTLAVAQRGQLVRLDFAEPDSDGDRIPDRWELQYFGSVSGATRRPISMGTDATISRSSSTGPIPWSRMGAIRPIVRPRTTS